MERAPSSRPASLALLILLLLLGACGDDEDDPDRPRAAPPATGTTPEGERPGRGAPPASEGAGEPGAAQVWVGSRAGGPPGTYIRFANQLVEPGLVEPANGTTVVGLRWSDWGEEGAAGGGTAEVDSCDPSCAEGGLIRRKGARVTVFDLEKGRCRGTPGRFYTRARFEWPRGLMLPRRQTVRLAARCPNA